MAETTKAELQQQAEELNVSAEGTKDEIVARIETAPSQLKQCPSCDFQTWQGNVLNAHIRSQHEKETK